MAPIITAPERASFRRCRRQWDFSAGLRRNLEPAAGGATLDPGPPDLDRAIRDALAIYYYPGMWDWDRSVRLPLVTQELERALARQQATGTEEAAGAGRALLARYVAWAPGADRFAPVLVEADFEVIVPDPDPARPGSGLVTPDGAAVRYGGRIDLLAVDAHDAYWIVRHRLAEGDWIPAGQLATDEEALAACWAWEQFYLGLAITGTIWNELRVQGGESPEPRTARSRPWPWRRRPRSRDGLAARPGAWAAGRPRPGFSGADLDSDHIRMTDRKPTQHSFPSWIDQQIADAEKRGVFDNLPGAGKPIPHRREADFTQAWLRDKLRREGVPTEEMLPTPLRLRRESERLTAGQPSLRSEPEVREAVAELNTRILDWRRNSIGGPPIPVPLVREDEAVRAWHQAQAASPPAAVSAPDDPPAPRRRWRFRRRRR